MNSALIFLIFCALYCNAEEGYFWHLTDFHWDFSYWTKELSCNGKNVSDKGPYGNSWCDSPWLLIEETIKGIHGIKPDVDFMLWTGDSVPHVAATHLSTELNKEIIRNITQLMHDQFPSVPIYATFGNHDYYPRDQYPPHNNEVYNATYLLWHSWIGDVSQEHYFLKGGYYTVKTQYGLRVIALNTNMYYKDLLTKDLDDPADQFVWLEAQLTSAALNNEKVLLTGHVPPGYSTPRAVRWMYANFNKKFHEIVLRHSDVIVALHFGHEHHDNFRLFYDSKGSAVASLFIAPSVTPWRYVIGNETEPPHYPGARLIKYDRRSGRQLDLIQYYVDLSEANRQKRVNWTLGYSATNEYMIPDIMPESLGALVSKFQSPNSQLFKKYVNWYNTNAVKDYPCSTQCHKTVMCGFRYLTQEDFLRCVTGVSKSSTISDPYILFIILLQIFATN